MVNYLTGWRDGQEESYYFRQHVSRAHVRAHMGMGGCGDEGSCRALVMPDLQGRL